jgi:hypothetical protein
MIGSDGQKRTDREGIMPEKIQSSVVILDDGRCYEGTDRLVVEGRDGISEDQ